MVQRNRRQMRVAGAALGAALCSTVFGLPAAGQGGAEDAPAILDERGWLTCRAFAGMSRGLQSAYLIGLREGWQTASGALEANSMAREEPAQEYQQALGAGAVYLRSVIDQAGATYGQVLDRTRAACAATPTATAWKAWLDALRELRAAAGAEEPDS